MPPPLRHDRTKNTAFLTGAFSSSASQLSWICEASGSGTFMMVVQRMLRCCECFAEKSCISWWLSVYLAIRIYGYPYIHIALQCSTRCSARAPSQPTAAMAAAFGISRGRGFGLYHERGVLRQTSRPTNMKCKSLCWSSAPLCGALHLVLGFRCLSALLGTHAVEARARLFGRRHRS